MTADEDDEQGEQQTATDGQDRDTGAGAKRRKHDGQHAPRGRVVEGTCGQRQGAQSRVAEAAFMNDTRQHREGSQSDTGAQEQSGIGLANALGKQAWYTQKPRCNQDGDEERRGDTRQRNRKSALAIGFEVVAAEGGSDQEHIKADTELRADIQHVLGFFGEQCGREVREEQAEKRWPEDNAGDHFADDLRLLEKLLAQPADDAAGNQDKAELQEEMDGKVARRHRLGDSVGANRAVGRQHGRRRV